MKILTRGWEAKNTAHRQVWKRFQTTKVLEVCLRLPDLIFAAFFIQHRDLISACTTEMEALLLYLLGIAR